MNISDSPSYSDVRSHSSIQPYRAPLSVVRHLTEWIEVIDHGCYFHPYALQVVFMFSSPSSSACILSSSLSQLFPILCFCYTITFFFFTNYQVCEMWQTFYSIYVPADQTFFLFLTWISIGENINIASPSWNYYWNHLLLRCREQSLNIFWASSFLHATSCSSVAQEKSWPCGRPGGHICRKVCTCNRMHRKRTIFDS